MSNGRREETLTWPEHDEMLHYELEQFRESGMNGGMKWYEHNWDMFLRLSRPFPDVQFGL